MQKLITTISPKRIEKIVLAATAKTIEQVRGKSRQKDLPFVRHLLMWALYRFTPATLKEVSFIVNKDHATVVYACKKIEGLRGDKYLGSTIAKVERRASL